MSTAQLSHSGRYIQTHWKLLLRVSRAELIARFAGSLIGIGWAALTPLLLLAIYGAVYLLVFRIRAPGLDGPEYLILIFTGLVPFLMTSEALVTGISSVVSNKSVLSNTVFPIDLVPVKAVLISQVTMIAGMLLVIPVTVYLGRLSPTLLLFPVIWLLHIMFLIGLLWILSLINLILRDLQNIIGVIVIYLMIASPIAYTREMVPAGLAPLLALNPLAHFIQAYQNVVLFARPPGASEWVVLFAMSGLMFAAGGYFFSRAKASLIDYV